MANWEGRYRSNYFKVKDVKKFEEWVDALTGGEGKAKLSFDADCSNRVCIFGYGSIPDPPEDEKGDRPDFFDELALHLETCEIAVIQEVGWEGLRYLTGYSTAIDWLGRVATASIDDIFKDLSEAGFNNVSNCTVFQQKAEETTKGGGDSQ